MTTLKLEIELPDNVARDARAAGLLTPDALRELIEDVMRRRAGQSLLAGAARGSAATTAPMTLSEIQVEVKAVRRERSTEGGQAR